MTQRSAQSYACSRCAPWRFGRLGVCALTVVFAGCAARQAPKAQTFPWATVKSVRPLLPKPASSSGAAGDDFLAEVELAVPPPPSPLAAIQSMPQRPHLPSTPAAQTAASQPEPPQITPQLTAEETASAQQQTNLSLSIAERNITASQGKALSPTQSDLASKVRSFITEARDAAHVADWTRARNAAKKAQVLSEELARSL
jgi:hypothetical protein